MKSTILLLLLSLIGRPQYTPTAKPAYFIAMEYKGLSNCIYKVYVTDSLIYGAKVNGYIGEQPRLLPGVVPQKWVDPEAYVNKKMDKYDDLLSDHSAFLDADKDNFIIQKAEIKQVWNNPKKKWGMGSYPYSGRIEIEAGKTPENRKGDRELILVGYQRPDLVLGLFR